MFDSEMISLTVRASDLLANAEGTTGELPVADIRGLLALKYEADKLSKRIDAALSREQAPA